MLDFSISTCQSEEERQKEQKSCRGIIYMIKDGDTLYGISKKYQMRVRDILFSNPYIDIYNLQIGEELCIPSAEDSRMQAMEEFDTYIVKENDSILSIIKDLGVSFEELAKLNKNISDMTLPKGTILLLQKKK